MISELVMVRDGVLAFTDSHFSTANACSSTEFLCTVRGQMFFLSLFLIHFEYEYTIIIV